MELSGAMLTVKPPPGSRGMHVRGEWEEECMLKGSGRRNACQRGAEHVSSNRCMKFTSVGLPKSLITPWEIQQLLELIEPTAQVWGFVLLQLIFGAKFKTTTKLKELSRKCSRWIVWRRCLSAAGVFVSWVWLFLGITQKFPLSNSS